MPSLIGTAPNQVPVNAMLGSAAYQDVNNFAVETKDSSDNSDFAASTQFVQTAISANFAASTQFVQTAISANTLIDAPPGAVMFFASMTAPTGWLKANGAVISRSTYSTLFSAIGTTFGSGDGSTTFNLPDLRGEFLRGWDQGRGVNVNRVFGTWEDQMLQNHKHSVNIRSEFAQGGDPVAYVGTSNAGSNQNGFVPYSGPVVGATTGTETRPRNVALLACIKI